MEALGDIIFTWARRMGQNNGLTGRNFDSHLRIKVVAL